MYDGPIDDEPIGRRVARLRKQRGLTQPQLAGLLDKSVSWVSAIERGVRPIDRDSVRRDLCRVLQVPLSELAPDLHDTNSSSRQPAAAQQLTVAIMAPTAATQGRESSSGDIDSRLVTVDTLWSSARLLEAAEVLARLIPDVEASARTGKPTAAATVHAYRAAAEVLSELGEHTIALAAAQHARCAATGSGALALPSASTTVRVLRRAGYRHEATALAVQTINAVADRARGGQPAAIATRGALLLELAAIHADNHDTDRAYEYLEQARTDATKLGSDSTYSGIHFGLNAVGLREASIDLAFGHAEDAKKVLDGLDTTGKSILQLVQYWVLRCRVEAELGHTSAAAAAADNACDLAPAVANDPALHSVVSKLLATNTKHRGDVRTLCRRIGAL